LPDSGYPADFDIRLVGDRKVGCGGHLLSWFHPSTLFSRFLPPLV
jgi:hypothetical protein